MKKKTFNLTIILLLFAGCGGQRESRNDDFIKIDVTANYPNKELILQDFADVEYVTLETNDDFICQGQVMAVGKDIILAKNLNADGNIFIYDRNGKGLRKINRKGQGGEEYLAAIGVVLDEYKGEIFVNNFLAGRTICVYDLYGKFKRRLNNENPVFSVFFQNDNDRDVFIGYNNSMEYNYKEDETKVFYHAIFSKSDRSVIQDIYIPFKEKKTPNARLRDGDMVWQDKFNYNAIIPYKGNFILSLPASDTVYTYFSDNRMLPFMVRKPSIQTMEREIFVFPQVLTEHFYFFLKVEKKKWEKVNDNPFVQSSLLYDRKDRTMYTCTVYNNDYSIKKIVDMSQQELIGNDIAFWNIIQADALVASYNKGELKEGKLKEIAATLKEDDNPVIMIVKHKK